MVSKKQKNKNYGGGYQTPTGGVRDNGSNSDPYNSRADGSYDDQDRSFNDNSFSHTTKVEVQQNRALLEQLMEEKTQM